MTENKDEIIVYNKKVVDVETKTTRQFKTVKSAASFKFSEVKSFIFGGFSSRFWMMRKHMNMIDTTDEDLMDLPFYSW
jgi:hypothetical protein